MPDQPQQVGQKDQERGQPTDPHPAASEEAPLRREHQSRDYANDEERHRILVLHPDAGEHAEPQPVTRLAGADRSHHAPRTGHPDERLECIHGQPVVKDQVDWNAGCGHCGQRLSETSAAEFARQECRRATPVPPRRGPVADAGRAANRQTRAVRTMRSRRSREADRHNPSRDARRTPDNTARHEKFRSGSRSEMK